MYHDYNYRLDSIDLLYGKLPNIYIVSFLQRTLRQQTACGCQLGLGLLVFAFKLGFQANL